jgi:predicted GNAT family acetyltransferase
MEATGAARVVDNPDELQYELWLGQTRAGFLAYRREHAAVVLRHTEVDPAFEGQGLGSRLVAGVLADLRNRGLKVVPRCPFVAGYLRRHAEHQDLVVKASAVSD